MAYIGSNGMGSGFSRLAIKNRLMAGEIAFRVELMGSELGISEAEDHLWKITECF